MNTLAVRPTETIGEDLGSWRFRDATLPHLDAVYTFARYLLRDPSDVEDAVQECYLRALRHFDTPRYPDVKPWLLAILRSVCRGEYGRRSRVMLYNANVEPDQLEGAIPPCREAPDTAETQVLRKLDDETIRGLVAPLPDVPRSDRAARDRRSVVSRDCPYCQCTSRCRDVAPGARV
jgi:RNA polymerase sigma-70 factor (ECF subfamily)